MTRASSVRVFFVLVGTQFFYFAIYAILMDFSGQEQRIRSLQSYLVRKEALGKGSADLYA